MRATYQAEEALTTLQEELEKIILHSSQRGA